MDIAHDLAPTGILRASINLGNPVLVQSSPDAPTGVTVDIARELAARLRVPVELCCFDAALASFEAIERGDADICFLAIDPARQATVAFTAPYAVIEGVFAVPTASWITTTADVDSPGVRVGVKKGSAYDLFLTRSLDNAVVVRGDEGITVLLEEKLEVAAGIRGPVEEFAAAHAGIRVIEPRFMEIRQAVGTTRDRSDDAIAYLHAFVEDLKASGFIAHSLQRAGRSDAIVAAADG